MAQVTPIQVPLTAGVVRSFGHLRLQCAGLEYTGGFTKAKLSRKREREQVYSNNPDPVGKTLGENKYECSMTVYFDWWMNTLQTIEQDLGPGYGDQPFTIFVSYVGKNLVTYTDQVLNCTLDETTMDHSQGTKALTCELNFNPTKILFNGVDDLEDPLVSSQP